MREYDAFAAHPLYAKWIAPDEARFMDRARTLYDVPDAADTDTDELLRAAGLGDAEIEHMRTQGIVA